MSYSVPLNLVVILSFAIFIFYLLGIHNILTNLDENGCEMTYMFEFPQFVEISMPAQVRDEYPRYALYGYAEGGHTEKLRQMRFNGIPVLFIPGSSGSYKQGRSLASVSLRKALNSRTTFYFDYFMVDFNEDLSAVYGGTLEGQTRFVRHCISKILSFYSRDQRNSQTSVILIGHSIGGIIAKAVFLDPKFNKESVQLIIALAAPLRGPILQPDIYIKNFYKNIDDFWKNSSVANETTLVSIGGGNKDVLVRSDLIFDKYSHVNVLSTAIPGVWCSTDHLSIVWCKQLVLTLVRAMFDCVDLKKGQLTTDHDARLSVLKYHLLQRSAGKRFAKSQYERHISFEQDAHWYENMLRQFSVVHLKGPKKNSYIMIRLHQDPSYNNVFVETFNLNIKDWIFVCSADMMYKSVRICKGGENLSNLTEIAPVLPLSRVKRKFVHLNLMEYRAKDFTHIIIKVPKLDYFVQVNVDIHDQNSRVLNHTVPSMYYMSKETIIKQTEENAVYYKINLFGFGVIWQAYLLGLETVSCKTPKNSAVISFMIPWAPQHYHYYMNDQKSISVKLSLINSKRADETEPPFVHLSLDPTCTYKVTIKPSLLASGSQVVLYFTGVLPAYVVAVLLLTIRQQIQHLVDGECVFFHSALCSAVRRYYLIIQATILGSKIFSFGLFSAFLPVPDFCTLEELNMDFFMTILMYGVAIIVTYSSGIACYVSVIVGGNAAHKTAMKFIAKTVTGFLNWPERFLSLSQQMPVIASALLLSLTLSTPGSLALALGGFFYFLKICSMYDEYLEGIFHFSLKFVAHKVMSWIKRKKPERKIDATVAQAVENKSEGNAGENPENDESRTDAVVQKDSDPPPEEEDKEIGLLSVIHYHVSIFLLWSMLALLHTPSLLSWARNYRDKVFVEKDPAFVSANILNMCCIVLWQPGVPSSNRKFTRLVSAVLFVLAAISIVYASVSLYRLSYVISAAMVVLSLHEVMCRYLPS